ncbi:daunorubicin resistance protein DrrA family ABC transporter ATP-binding protein [Embleya scabrispora]|uniref:daunorubicin resistance protein DrrA family ABC transporter ATP-binding protein n=1 Tax=Embleya scabrispora TaxID=159449 RepID=UPI00037FD5BB|nr:daunorubicin resistance protein DrrA family ABC transporter ATP-binding protein [Embleya scabrispora]MYS79153.1 daunorubicin resistance protein DrrA family ABC transporter ATP-binding protein [Streptomyces sp. SID5474]
MNEAIDVEDLGKRFGAVTALESVDFRVAAGTVFGLLGPNGAGKSTAIRILTTIARPTAGRAFVLGHDVVRDAATVRSMIGLAGQYAAVDKNLTGRENLRLIGRLTHIRRSRVRARAAELLERFDLAEAGDRPARTYSGGMRRRLDVAAALVPDPPVLFLDEPTTGLDPQSRNALWEMIRGLVADGTTVLLTTQYLEEADQLAERVVVIDRGRVIADDTPAALKARLGNTVIELDLEEAGRGEWAAQLVSARFSTRADVEGSRLRLTSHDGSRPLLDILRLLDAHGLVPGAVAVHESSLDDVFLELTGRRANAAPESARTSPDES